MTAAAVFVPAWAKINLTLSVLGKRSDGYHALTSVMQTISLCDTLRIETTVDDRVTCAVDVTELDNDDNLVVKAARLLQAEEQVTGGVIIELHKAIPSPGGLGGGSSDAAAVLTALARLRGLQLPQTRLEELGARLGSDVPFFVHGGTALVEGRGEFVKPLPDVEPLWLVIARPPVGISTAAVFSGLTRDDYSVALDTDAVVGAIRSGLPLPLDRLSNTLEQTVMRRWPPVAATRDALLSAGAPIVRMSGSGPTLFAPFVALKDAAQVYESTRQADIETWLCHTVSHTQVVGSLPALPRT
ncbi:MAG TPA: 4-(cytidine 5'-diphospho)-2-C-methyl-D-erythritol kinase [Ktedonobacterales bacterium]|nr:4-(cytidine 5'-diphospho)-2-C-methyl-D-erythritol kinase [Ktedonobacterales bacterium]